MRKVRIPLAHFSILLLLACQDVATVPTDPHTSAFLSAGAEQQNGSITDLGTLGGRLSWAHDINSRGQVVGISTLAGDNEQHAVLWQSGKIIDLGQAGVQSEAYGINGVGDIVGHIENRPTVWRTDGSVVELGAFGAAQDISENGQIVGFARVQDGTYHATLWEGGRTVDLGTLGGPHSVAHAINARGQIVGESEVLSRAGPRAFIWEDGLIRDIGTLGGCCSIALGINAAGEVVGWSALADGTAHAFLWWNGKMTDLGTLGGTNSEATDITNSGYLVGSSGNEEDEMDLAFVRIGTRMIALPTLGDCCGVASAINEKGQVVGGSQLDGSTTHATMWTFD
jgi:probable HAF family extracellular repeat protein